MSNLNLQELKKQNEQYIEESEAYSPLQVKQLITNYEKAVDALKYYADPELWMIKDKHSWKESSPKCHGDDELIVKYKHPNRDWIGSVAVGGKLARQTLKELGEI